MANVKLTDEQVEQEIARLHTDSDSGREAYQAWKFYWLSSGRTLEDAVEYGRQHGGEAYAEKLKQIIQKMEDSP